MARHNAYPNRAPRVERTANRRLSFGLGTALLISTLASSTASALTHAYDTLGAGANRNTPTHVSPFPFTTASLEAGQRGPLETVFVDPANRQVEVAVTAYEPSLGKALGRTAFVSIDGGKTWANLSAPAANGLAGDPTLVIDAVSFAPGPDNNIAQHSPGTELGITMVSKGGQQVSVELATVNSDGVTVDDVESATGMGLSSPQGVWAPDGSGSYTYTLPGTNAQGAPITIQAAEVHGGK